MNKYSKKYRNKIKIDNDSINYFNQKQMYLTLYIEWDNKKVMIDNYIDLFINSKITCNDIHNYLDKHTNLY